MLDVKKWMAKVTSFINANKEQTLTITGTTNSDGAMAVWDRIPIGATITKASVTNYANAMCIPFIYDNRLWFIKVVEWQSLNVDVANTSLNFVIKYKVGGGTA